MTVATSSKGKSTNVGMPGVASEKPFPPIADATNISSEAASGLSREEIKRRLEQISTNLKPFVEAREDLTQIFVINDGVIQLEENTPSAIGGEQEAATLTELQPAHNEAKKYFVEQLTELYGASAVAILYPEEEREQTLTVGKAQDLIRTFAALQQAVVGFCQGDLSKYDDCLAAELGKVMELKKAIANPPSITPAQQSYFDFVSKQTGVPVWLLHSLLGTALVGAVTGGASLLLHAGVATALAHAPLMGAVGPSHLGVATSTMGQAVGGLSTGNVSSLASSATTALSHLHLTKRAIAAGSGAIGGTIFGAMKASGTSEEPATTQQIVGGMVAGAIVGGLLGGLSEAYNAITIGGVVAATTGGAGALHGMVTGGREGGARGVISGGIRGAAPGLLAGGSIILFGGMCTAIAAHATAPAVAATALTPTQEYGGIAAGTAVAGYLTNQEAIHNAVTTRVGAIGNAIQRRETQNQSDQQMSVIPTKKLNEEEQELSDI